MSKNVIIYFVIFTLLASNFLLFFIYKNNLEENNSNFSNNFLIKKNLYWSWINNFNKENNNDFLLESNLYQNWEKKFDEKINNVFLNIDYFLKNNTIEYIDKNSLINETYLSVWNLLLFKFIKNIDECKEISKSYFILDKNYFKKDCEFNYYLKNQLSNNDNNIPQELKKYNTLFDMVKSNNCNLMDNTSCYLLWNNKTFNDYKLDILNLASKNNINIDDEINNFTPVDHWFYLFENSLTKINKINIIDSLYDQALLFKYIRQKDKNICLEMKFEENKIFCNDFFDDSKDEYYKKLYEQFFIKLYHLQEKNEKK